MDGRGRCRVAAGFSGVVSACGRGEDGPQFTLQNLGDAPIDAQIRVFHSTQNGRDEQLPLTTDFVASPPAATFAPPQEYVVRLVHTAEVAVQGGEACRLLVDELPPALPASSAVSTVRLHAGDSVVDQFCTIAMVPPADAATAPLSHQFALCRWRSSAGSMRLSQPVHTALHSTHPHEPEAKK